MKQIIELAQELFSKEQSVLSELQNDKEYALNEALKRQSEIPVQEAKVEALAKDLQDLYTRYGYADSDNGASVSPAIPAVNKYAPPMKADKKSMPSVSKDDIIRVVNGLSTSDYREALRLLTDLDEDL